MRKIALVILLLATSCGPAGAIEDLGRVTFEGKIADNGDVSALASAGDLLYLASDEGALVQILRRDADRPDGPAGQPARGYRVLPDPLRLADGDAEVDLEGLALEGDVLYAIGSHSLVRKKLRDDKSQRDNRRRLGTVSREKFRDRVFRIALDPTSGLPTGSVTHLDLRSTLAADPLLGRFTEIPGKENGIDLEGIAASGGRLFLGFRSPVLRGGVVPVMVLDEARPESHELRFLDLDGRGIRDLVRVDGGFLVVAAAERDTTYEIYFWTGIDLLPGKDAPRDALVHLGRIPTPGAAEGLAVLEETETQYTALVVFDNETDGACHLIRIPRKRD